MCSDAERVAFDAVLVVLTSVGVACLAVWTAAHLTI